MSRLRATAFLVLVAGVCTIAPAKGNEPFRFPSGKDGKGELLYLDGIPLLVVQGTPQEIRNSDNPIVQQFVEGTSEGPLKTI